MDDILLDVSDGIAKITINRPESLNAMTSNMWGNMADMLRGFENSPEVRCVIITGAGENFCAGGDVKEFSTTLELAPPERARHWMGKADQGNALFLVMERLPQPILVSARGIAAGGGLAIVAAADLVVASNNSRFFVAQIKLGAIPDSAASYNLLRNMGIKRAKQYCFLGDILDSNTALELDLVNWVVPDSELAQRTNEIAARLAKVPSIAMARTKAAINAAQHTSLACHMYQETIDIGACVSQDAFEERVRGFIERHRE